MKRPSFWLLASIMLFASPFAMDAAASGKLARFSSHKNLRYRDGGRGSERRLPIKALHSKPFGSGANSDVWEVTSKDPRYKDFGILKIIRPYSRNREPAHATGTTLQQLGDIVVSTGEKLRKSKRFRKVAGNKMIPKAMVVEPGLLLQEKVDGITKYELIAKHGQAKYDAARVKIKEIAKVARKVLGSRFVVSPRGKNFLFDPNTGDPVAWVDHLSDGASTYRKKGKKRYLTMN